MKKLLKLRTRIVLTIILGFFISLETSAQYCDSIVPTFNVDLSASPNMNWTSPPVVRDGHCCGTTNPDRCLEFVITLHPSAIAVNFQITGGAIPPGALFYQIDCGPVTPVGDPICLDGPGPHTLTFCKPGNNTNEFTITSYSAPVVGPDITLNAACQGFIYGNYYDESSVTWTSIAPGATGDYDYLLSCTSGCDTTYVTAPSSGAPAFVDYYVCGMDVGGCDPNPICDTIRVHFIPPVTVNITDGGPFCAGDTTTLTANVSGGSGPYNIVWSTTETTGTITVGAGAYSVQVTDTSGCLIATDNINVVALPLPNVDAGPDQTVCEGTAVTLSGSAAATNFWDNGVIDGVAFTPAVGTTTYTVTGTDANGCVNTDQVDVTVNPLPVVNAGPDQTVCEGTAVTLSGSGAATYVWDNGVIDGVAFTPAVGTMTYTVSGTDANGCVNTDQVDVTVNPLPVVNAGPDQEVCEGEQVTLNGSGAATYVWDNGVVDGVAFTLAVGTTTYTVTGTDANGCQDVDQVDVTVNPLPIVNAGPDQTVCEGTAVTLSGSGAATYVWYNGVIEGVAFTPAVGTITYTVTGTDANGCQDVDQVDVTVNPLPVVSAGPDQEVCEGEQVTLNGSGAVTYVWDNGVIDGVAFTTTVGTTTYTVTGTDANACASSDQVDVTVNPAPFLSAGEDFYSCEDEEITLNAVGSPNLVWEGGIIDGVPFVPTGTQAYVVNDTLSTGCTATDTIIVYINPNPVVTAPDAEICPGEGVILNGAGAVSYVWDNGVTDGVMFYPTSSEQYEVIGTDGNGCSSRATSNVTILDGPEASFQILDLSLTTLDPTTGFANNSVGATSYEWNFGDGSNISTEFEPTHTFPTDEPGEYEITLTVYSEEGCPAQAVKYVHVFSDYTIYVPNAFTPDGNGANEIFKPVMDGFDPNDFELLIFNRWGNIIFESHNMEVGWDGTFARQDYQVQDGVYTWKITAGLEYSNDTKIFVGHVTLLQ